MQTLSDQLDNIRVGNLEDIKKLFPFVITKNYEEFSGWHGTTVTYTDYGFKKDNKKFWFGRRTSNKDKYYDYNDIIIILNTLKKSGFKFACNYCGKGMLGSSNRFLNPIDFIKWIKENDYHFESFSSIDILQKGYWRFHGNLKEYSCSFWFDIFDMELFIKIVKETGLKVVKQ